MDITSLLTFASQSGASDVHLSSGEPPMIRLNGDMKKLDHPALTREQVHGMVYDIMNDSQRKTYEEHFECDFSFAVPNLARFRVNAYIQMRGAGVVRVVQSVRQDQLSV